MHKTEANKIVESGWTGRIYEMEYQEMASFQVM